MGVRSRRLGSANPSPGGAYLFTVPADRVAIVKEITISNDGSSVTPIAVQVKLERPGRAAMLVEHASVGPGQLVTRPRWFVMHEGESLFAQGTFTDTVWAYASGALLMGDPA